MMRECDIHDQVERHRNEFAVLEDGHHVAIRSFLAGTVVFVHKLVQTPGAISHFFKHPFFASRTYALSEKDILRHYFCCTMNANTGSKYERACNYAVSLKHMLDEDFLDVKEVITVIDDAGGIEDLYRDQVARKKINKIGYSKLEVEGDEGALDNVFELEIGGKVPIVLERIEDGAHGWKRYRLAPKGG